MSWKPKGTQSAPTTRLTSVGTVLLLLVVSLTAIPGVAAAAPDTIATETIDLDKDGQIDAVKVTFSGGDSGDKLDSSTISPAGWTVTGFTVVDAILGGRSGLANHDNSYTTLTGGLSFYLILDEDTTPDTDATPDVSYAMASGDLQDDDGEDVGDIAATTAVDKAAPVLLSVAGALGAPTLTATFSEPVAGTGTSDVLVAADFTATGFIIQSVAHTAGTATATITAGANFVRTDSCADTLALKSGVDDGTAANAADTTAKEAIITGAPCLLTVTSNPGLTGAGALHEAVLTFSENVSGSGTGGALTPSDLTFDAAGGSSIIIASMGGDADATTDATASVLMTGPFALDDFDQAKFNPKTSVTATTGGGQVNPVTRTLSDVVRPMITHRETVDQDADGLIDAVRLRFSETLPSSQGALAKGDFLLRSEAGAGCGAGILYGDAAGVPDALTPGAGGFSSILVPFPEEGTPGVNGDTAAVPCIQVVGSESFVDVGDHALVPDGAQVQTTDKASPAILRSQTLDADVDGKIDGATVFYSEPLADAGSAADWQAETTVNSPGTTFTIGTPALVGGAPSAQITVPFTEHASPNTDELPKVRYKSAATGLEDPSGNMAVQGQDTIAADKAPPVLVSALWDPAPSEVKKVKLEFSEGVQTLAGGDLGAGAFTYTNGAAGTTQTIASVAHDADSDAAAIIVLTMNNDLASADASGSPDGDTVAAKTATSVYDEAVNAASTASAFVTELPFVVSAAATVDADGDGKIDAIDVTLSKAVNDPGSFSAAPWSFSGTTPSSKTAPDFVTTGATGNDNKVRLHITEDSVPDGGLDGFTVTYTCSGCPATSQIPAADGSGNLATSGATAADGVKPVPLTAFTQDVDSDGLLDAYAVFFSEPLNTGTTTSITPTGWTAGGLTASGASIVTDTSDLDGDADTAETYVRIAFPESSSVATGATPDLLCSSCTIRDVNGVIMADVGTGGLTEVDKAPPILILATSEVGETEATLTFSEGVFGASLGGSLVISHSGTPVPDIMYTDVAVAAPARTVTASSHTGGSATATVAFDKAFASTNDFGADRFDVTGGAGGMTVVDAAGNAAGTTGHLRVLTQANAADITPPGAINSLTAANPTSTSVELEWFAPGDDGSTGTVSSYEIKHHTSAITSSNYASATTATATFDPTSFAAAGGTQKATVTGLDAGTTYFFAVKGIDEADNRGGVSNSPSATTESVDDTPPADIGTVTTVETTANSVTLSFTAPGDDGATGTVSKYTVKVGSTAFTASNFAAGTDATFTATIVAGGATQTMQITGLDQDTEYFFGIQAEDEVPNKNAVKSVGPIMTSADTTPPTGTLTVTSSSHDEGVGVANRNPAFSWSGLSDAESTITYHYKLDQTEGTTITAATTGAFSGSQTGSSVDLSNVATGTWFFHVAGESAGGFSDTATYEIRILETSTVVTRAQIQAANADVRDTIEVTRSGGDNTVTWSLAGIDPEPTGVQVWRATSPFVLIATLEEGDAAFEAAEYVDEDAPADAVYLITVFYTADASGGQVDDLDLAPGYAGLSDQEQMDLGTAADSTDGVPWWGWLLIALGILVLIAIIVGIIVASRRSGSEEEWDDEWDDEADTWDEEADTWDDTAAPVETHHEAAAPAHELECPKCSHEFTAHGHKPLTTTCPSCGVKGVLN